MQSIINKDILNYCCPCVTLSDLVCLTFKINMVCFKVNSNFININ